MGSEALFPYGVRSSPLFTRHRARFSGIDASSAPASARMAGSRVTERNS